MSSGDDWCLAHCPCICGASLDDAPSHGVWTIADVACEYRMCLACHATRAYAPAVQIDGALVVAINPDGSEDAEGWWSLLDALEQPPRWPGAMLVRCGAVLARTYCGVDGVHGWRVLAPSPDDG